MQQRGALLCGDDIEEAIHQLWRMHIIERLRLHIRQAIRQIRRRADKDAAFMKTAAADGWGIAPLRLQCCAMQPAATG